MQRVGAAVVQLTGLSMSPDKVPTLAREGGIAGTTSEDSVREVINREFHSPGYRGGKRSIWELSRARKGLASLGIFQDLVQKAGHTKGSKQGS